MKALLWLGLFALSAYCTLHPFYDIAADDNRVTPEYNRLPTPGMLQAYEDTLNLTPFNFFSPDVWKASIFPGGVIGIGLIDYDKDGNLDILVSNGPGRANNLYKNSGGLSPNFTDVADGSGMELVDDDVSGVCFGDVNNDGYDDILALVLNGTDHLLLNNGDGTFDDITTSAGIDTSAFFPIGCSMGDVNNDGYLDLYIINAWHMYDTKAVFALSESNVTNPDNDSQFNLLLVNNGNLTFFDATFTCGDVGERRAPTWAGVAWDYDQDGDCDLINVEDEGPYVDDITPTYLPGSSYDLPDGIVRGKNVFLKNNGDLCFDDATIEVNMNARHQTGAMMGIDTGDLNCDGWTDFAVTDFGFHSHWLINGGNETLAYQKNTEWYFGTEHGNFTHPQVGILGATPFGWGISLFDYDNDGDLDILYVGGLQVATLAEASNPGAILENQDVCSGVFWSDAAGFSQTDHVRRMDTAFASGDLNGDGWTDIVSACTLTYAPNTPLVPTPVTANSPFDDAAFFIPLMTPNPNFPLFTRTPGITYNNGSLTVELNQLSDPEFEDKYQNNHISVFLVGGKGLISNGKVNRNGVGAIVHVAPKNYPKVHKPIHAGASFSSQDAFKKVFGYGDAKRGDVQVMWPGENGGVWNYLRNVKRNEDVVFPEIPCNYKGTWSSFKDYKDCVKDALDELVSEGVLPMSKKGKFYSSAIYGYLLEH